MGKVGKVSKGVVLEETQFASFFSFPLEDSDLNCVGDRPSLCKGHDE